MGLAMEILTGRAANPGAIFTAVTNATGDSLAVRSFPLEAGASLCNAWATGATAGRLRIRSPRMHDNVQNLRFGYVAATPRLLFPEGLKQRLFPQDTLVVELTGGAAETDVESLLVYYRDLPGTMARLAAWEEIEPRIVNLLTVENAGTSSATVGDYGGGEALNADFDLLKANVDYAIIGYLTDIQLHAVGYRGPETGNLRVGGPGTSERLETRDYFKRLSQMNGVPAIPVVNAANRGSTLIDVVHNVASTAFTVQTFLAELAA